MADKYDPPEGTKGDAAHAVVRSALGAIPVAGTGATELFNWLVAPPIERRRKAWTEQVAAALRDLEARGIDIEGLRDNDAFIDVVFQATQAAMHTSQESKREALRNAILNAALPGAPEASEQQIFVGLVDNFTEWHLRLLQLFQDPREHVSRNTMMGGLSQVVETAFPQLRGRRDFYDQVWSDLNTRGLVNTSTLHVTMSGHGLTAKRTTDFGDRFLAFISEPTGT